MWDSIRQSKRRAGILMGEEGVTPEELESEPVAMQSLLCLFAVASR